MQIYALALEKGGVGKTCLAVNVHAFWSLSREVGSILARRRAELFHKLNEGFLQFPRQYSLRSSSSGVGF